MPAYFIDPDGFDVNDLAALTMVNNLLELLSVSDLGEICVHHPVLAVFLEYVSPYKPGTKEFDRVRVALYLGWLLGNQDYAAAVRRIVTGEDEIYTAETVSAPVFQGRTMPFETIWLSPDSEFVKGDFTLTNTSEK